MPGFLQRFMPRDGDFFVLFQRQAENVVSGAKAFVEMLEHYTGVPEQVHSIKAIEHNGDEITHQIFRKLNQTFITPFDREDMHELASTMDSPHDRSILMQMALVWSRLAEYRARHVGYNEPTVSELPPPGDKRVSGAA